jgi:hypothetical protein
MTPQIAMPRLSLLMTFWVSLVIGIGIALSTVAAHCAESTMQRDAPTTRLYNPNGSSAGTASTYGNTTKFYAPDGRLVGSATRNGRR